MAIKYNGTTIPTSGTIKYNGVSLTKVIYAGVTVWEKITAGFKYWNHNSGSGSPSVSRTFTAEGGYYITQATGWHQNSSGMTLTVAGSSKTVTSAVVASDKFIKRCVYNTSSGNSVVCNANAGSNSTSYGNVSMITYLTGSSATYRAGGGSTDSGTGTTSYTLTANSNVVVIVTGYKSTTTPTVTLAGTSKSVTKTETSGDFRYWIYTFTGTNGQQITVSHKANANYGNTVATIYTY